ncbi:MAG TPA: type II toxin-antitoxin system RelE/ParE family toxin [Cytophagaceae bacterium]|jgi:plasmid stabilization system protein ParE|nr:type II toxin-antitoxin system RelE/ParE family toxin [Cytophagaceae bacterium]
MRIIWTRTARTDLRFIFDYYKYKANLFTAQKIKNACLDRVNILYQNPEAGSLDEFLEPLKENHRYLVEGNYKIIYKISSDIIFITGVFDTRQNPEKIISKN